MTDTFLATPENWFDLLRRATSSAAAGIQLQLTLTDADGRHPLEDVALEELRAIHQTFGMWWPVLGAGGRPSSVGSGDYDRFLTESRALLKRTAEAALAPGSTSVATNPALAAFPDLDDERLRDSADALALFRNFLAIYRSPSLVVWVRRNAPVFDPVGLCGARPWLRLLLQKVAVDRELPEAIACLRAIYGTNGAGRAELLAEEDALLQRGDLSWGREWALSLGLDRPPRTELGIQGPGPRGPRSPRQPDVTVLVPSFCHEAFIETTLESVLAQTHSAFHLVVVDDRSPDGTVERASRTSDDRLRVEVNDRNLGLGDSILKALDGIETPYVALLNSDDIFHPDRLERCLAVLDQQASVQVVATGVVPIDTSGCALSVHNVNRLFDGARVADWLQWFADAGGVKQDAEWLPELLERNFLITSSNIVCRTDFLRARTDALRGLKYCFDWQVFLDAAVERSLVCIADALVGYRLHPSNTVWFDDAGGTMYALEVNRVLGRTFRQVREASSREQPIGVHARILELVTANALKHSEANGLMLYALELLGSPGLAESVVGSEIVRRQIRAVASAGSAARASMRNDDLTAVVVSREDQLAAAARILADVLREETMVAERLREEVARVTAAALVAAADQQRQTEALVRSLPEWIVGDVLWNRAGLSKVGWPAARGVRSMRDWRNRLRLSRGRLPQNRRRPRAVVAACWSFPIPSQTFVYQEMQGLEWAGFDYHVFCCQTNPKENLPSAFDELWAKQVVLQSDKKLQQRDFDHFLRTRPDRVERLLVRLGAAMGLTREALLNESIVKMGFTFARYVELSGAQYLHTYFFYDQSLMALMAAFLLQIPRGITAYADHMLDDYKWKCVPLQLELADIVVATSERIKSELSQIGGRRFDAKMLVKPNGIDTTRFPNVLPASRLTQNHEPELISVSRIEPKKGLIYLVEAVAILKHRRVPVRLHIVGGVDQHTASSAECFRELKARIDALEVSDRIVLHGSKQQSEFLPLLLRSRIFVAPYVEDQSGDKDGIPTALLEAMSSGLPIVATDAGSISEAMADGVEGLCVPQRDPERLADAIERLLSDGPLYVRLAEGARRRALAEFDARITETRLHERIRASMSGAPVLN